MTQLIHTQKFRFAAFALIAALYVTGCTGPRSDAAPAASVENARPTSPGAPALAQPSPDLPAQAPPSSAIEPPVATRPAKQGPRGGTPAASRRDASGTPSGELACRSNADCVVKDVGSCCGYQPRCLNAKAETFPEEVRQRCASEGRVGTCGFREIAGCECVQGKCAAIHDDSDGGVVR